MKRFICAVTAAAAIGGPAHAQRAATPAATAFLVAYFEVAPSSRSDAIGAWKAYVAASRRQDGYVDAGLFEQIGRTGHFSVVERWRDQPSADAHERTASTRTWRDALRPLQLADYDERPYEPIAVGRAEPEPGPATIYVITHVDTIPTPQSDAPGMLTRLAGASRQDEGNLRFDVLQHAMHANHFTLIEAWRDEQALERHAAAAHTKRYRSELQPMAGSPLDERLFRLVR